MKSAGTRDESVHVPPKQVSPPPAPPSVDLSPRDGFTFYTEYWLGTPGGDIDARWYPSAPTAAVMFVIDGPATEISNIVVITGQTEWSPKKAVALGPSTPQFVVELPAPARIDRLTFHFSDPATSTRVLIFERAVPLSP
jgi:hypothetical protein